ncbi:MAG TPA: tripartite tricarboxylate transporter substrate binding protein, partial [Ramlibacter sp.]|nr:tripartite tricarboxylate transporter substrate binding protein [Ramlibacter sp.]
MKQPTRDRRHALLGAAAAALTLLTGTPLRAQERFPDRQLRLLVGSLVGGTTDVAARLLATRLASVLGQAVIVDNKAGAGGIIAGKEVAQARPDGYTLQMGSSSTNTLAPLLQSPAPFDLMADFEPVHVVGFVPLALFVPNELPARSIGELVALARSSPGKLSYASAGVGTTSHLTGELFKMQAGVDIVHVPYRGGPAMDLAVASGEVQLSFDSPGAIAELHQSRKVRALAVLANARSEQLPDVPTSKEADFPELVSLVSFYVLAPAKTPQAVLQTLHRGIADVMQNPEAQRELGKRGIQP